MDSVERQSAQKVLLVDDNEAVLAMMKESLENKGFEVAPARSVREALKLIATEGFDVLITDLHLPNPGDGFAVITAMRHTQPEVLTLLLSGYPDVKTAMDTVLLEANHVMVKPVELASLTELIHEHALTRKPVTRSGKQRAGAILKDCMPTVVADWLARTKRALSSTILTLAIRSVPDILRSLLRTWLSVWQGLKYPRKTVMPAFPALPYCMASCDFNRVTRRQCWCLNHEYYK